MKFIHIEHADNSPGTIGTCQNGNNACLCPDQLDSSMYTLAGFFYPAISSEKILLDHTTERLYDQNDQTKYVETTTYNYYDNPVHYQVTRNLVTDSKSNKHATFIKYPQDYITSGNFTGNTILDSLIGRNMLGNVIEKTDSLYLSGSSTGSVTGAQLTKFRFIASDMLAPDRQFQLAINVPLTNFQPFAISGNTTSQDSRYRKMINFDLYDSHHNLIQFTPADQVINSFIWDYQQTYPIAQVKNAIKNDIAYTSFESDGTGNWTITSTNRNSTNFLTGLKSYNLNNGNITNTNTLDANKRYTISMWAKTTAPTVSHSTLVKTGRSYNGFTYYEFKTNAGFTSFTISGTMVIDELRLYPTDAQMTTLTYQPLVGITSECDINNRINYYQYDDFGRLKLVIDQDGNIRKKIDYQYQSADNSGATACDITTNCTGNDKACIYNYCQEGKRYNTVTKYMTSGTHQGKWKCTYHYEWTDGSRSHNADGTDKDYNEYSDSPCDIVQ